MRRRYRAVRGSSIVGGIATAAIRRMSAERARRPRGAPPGASPAAVAQGLYYLLTGVWPLLSIRTFEAVTGPKVDRWLVKTVGVLVAVIGSALLIDARRPSAGSRALGIGSAIGLGGVDVVYAARGRIAKVYLLDALLEALLVGVWLRRTAVARARRRSSSAR
jgi:hypothetical protein